MDNETRYTEDEVRRREREAFVAGTVAAIMDGRERCEEVRRRYPIKKKVPRVVEIQRTRIRFFARVSEEHGGIRFYLDSGCTEPFNVLGLHAHEPAIYADLLARPYEEIEE
jgi:hypothetical protein